MSAATPIGLPFRTRRLKAGKIAGTAWWREYLALAAGRCAYCHVPEPALTVEHITPLSLHGSNEPDNLLPVCGACNHAKADRSLGEFVREAGLPAVTHAHPLGRIVAGEWVWTEAARRIQRERNRRRQACAGDGGRRPGRGARIVAGALCRAGIGRGLGDVAYAAAYDC